MHDLAFIPISALVGDNVVTRSESTPWYDGPSLLYHLEHLHVASDRNLTDVRFPVQFVIRPQQARNRDYRGYAGTVASGVIKPGDPIMALPSGFTTTVAGIDSPLGELDEAFPPMAVVSTSSCIRDLPQILDACPVQHAHDLDAVI